MSHVLRSLLPCLLALALLPAPAAGQETLEEATKRFLSQAFSNDLLARKQALDGLVQLGDAGAVPTLTAEFARVARDLAAARDEAFKLDYALERRRALFESMKKRAERDPSLEDALVRQRNSIEEMERKYTRAREVVASEGPWRDALGEGLRALFDAIGTSKSKKAEKELWKRLEETPDVTERIALIEMLGEVGSPGTALEIQKVIVEAAAERARMARKLKKLELDVRKEEQRLQAEQDRTGGATSGAAIAQYNRVKAEAAEMRRLSAQLAWLADACVEAGASALRREEGEILDKTLQAFVRALKRAKAGARLKTLELLGQAPTDGVRARLRALLAVERDAAGKARLIEDLGALGDEESVALLLDTYLVDEDWIVRSAAAGALADLRAKEAIAPLIERLEADEGRTVTDVRTALTALTGQDFRTNVELWRKWWAENEEGFEVPTKEAAADASDAAVEAVGVTFFGISTESRKVLFVLDLSGSMNYSMVPRNNPTDSDPNNPDWPREGEISRLTAAKRALIKAVGGLDEGSVFNLVLYASDVWTWKKQLESMEGETRSEVVEYVDGLEAKGGTNIFGALQQALDMAGAEEGDEWVDPAVDTIFLLTDGRPSIGVTTDPDEILSFVRELNQSAGITIHTIGLSGAQDAYLLRTLAEENGGTYVAH